VPASWRDWWGALSPAGRATARGFYDRIDPATVKTNIVIAELCRPADQERILAQLRAEDVLVGSMGAGRIRFVTHLGIDDAALERVSAALRRIRGSV